MSTPLTKEQLLALHPWPSGYADAKKIEALWVFDLPGTPAALWPFISDTSRMNRALGTSEMAFWEQDGKRYGKSKAAGVVHEWHEVPWNWVAEQWLANVRIYSKGLMRMNYALYKLERIETGTRLYVYLGCVPRGALSAVAIRVGLNMLKKAHARVLPQIAAQLDRLRPEVLQLPPPALSEQSESRLRSARDALLADGMPKESVDTLVDWLRTGDDADLHRIQIRERARTWKLPETDLLRVALHATRHGVLDLSWDTICPHCRGVRDETSRLAEVPPSSRCGACEIDFSTDKPETVEVTFRVHPAIRDIPEVVYCSAEPARREHVRVQVAVAPGAKTELKAPLAPGRYTVWAGHRGGWYLDVETDAPAQLVWEDHPEGTVVKAAPEPIVTFHNDGTEEESFTIERATWSDDALRPGMLLSFQDFRDLFSEDYLGADVKLAVGEQTLLFTDVVGSTAFYASRGDPAAFVEIKRHFDEVFAIVKKHRGAVVKTIGDAVMAAFVSPLDAVMASHAIHLAFHPDRDDTPIRLRISLNTGPCIAVRLNANADFFGGTVNIAAKLQALAEGYQIAMSETTYRGTGVADYIASEDAVVETLVYESKALKEKVAVRRWTVHAAERYATEVLVGQML